MLSFRWSHLKRLRGGLRDGVGDIQAALRDERLVTLLVQLLLKTRSMPYVKR